MTGRLPPLRALQAFEAAARHLSFTLAAKELFVTQAAVSQQVKVLEGHLGVALFKRMNRALALTGEGQDLLCHVHKGFGHLYRGVEQVVANRARGRLTVSVLPSVAAGWLVPRLGRFSQSNPEIDVLVSPSNALVDFDREDVDLAVRYGSGRYRGLRVDRLMDEDIFPVCSPALVKGKNGIRKPGDLARVHLLHDDSYAEWRTWLDAAGLKQVNAERGTIFTDASLVVQAAAQGQGVALARRVLSRDELSSGRLVKPFDLNLPTEYAYYIVTPKDRADRPKVALFREWLLAEGREHCDTD